MSLFSSILLSSVLPGYALLRLIDKKNKFGGLSSLVFSFFISFFLMSLTNYALMVFNIPIGYSYWVVVILNAALLVILSYKTLRQRTDVIPKVESGRISYKLDYLIIGCIFAFVIG